MKRILNIGCGKDTYGTDFVDIYPTREEVKKVDVCIDKLPFKNNHFDEIYSKNIFEHLKDPIFALNEMRRVLKKDGKIVIVTDNAGFIFFHVKLFRDIYLEHTSNEVRVGDSDRHYFLFKPLHLKNLFDLVGFRKINVEYESNTNKMRFKLFMPMIKLLSKTPITVLINPHLRVTAVK